jgi:hypothetical protein
MTATRWCQLPLPFRMREAGSGIVDMPYKWCKNRARIGSPSLVRGEEDDKGFKDGIVDSDAVAERKVEYPNHKVLPAGGVSAHAAPAAWSWVTPEFPHDRHAAAGERAGP